MRPQQPLISKYPALMVPLFLSACAIDRNLDPLKSSEACYNTFATRTHLNPSSRNYGTKVPWTSTEPQGSLILGEFKISADFATIVRAVQYNAKRVGADAVLIKKLNWWDIKAWSDPRTVWHTKTTPPSDAEKKEYEKQKEEYERAKAEGKKTTRPEPPKDSKETTNEILPGRWNVQGGAYLEALFLETPHPFKERSNIEPSANSLQTSPQPQTGNENKLSGSILEQAGLRDENSRFHPPSKRIHAGGQ